MITLGILAKNEEACIANPIKQLRPFVTEIIVIDDHSIDQTARVAMSAGADRVVPLPFRVSEKGFAEAINFLIAQASQEWVLFIDADEIMGDLGQLHVLTRYEGKNAWALPRRKWKSYPLIREEYEAYPDWQVRFFRKLPEHTFAGEMHIRFQAPHHKAYSGPHIEHMQEQYRDEHKTSQRHALYTKLAASQGVHVHGGHSVSQKE